jgi:hyperpolarization activated cyclic nucleotide-gated potassium channel 2
VTAIDDEALLIADYLSNSLTNMNYKEGGKVHFGGDDVSLYGTPKEEPGPNPLGANEKQSFIKNQLQALFQPTDNKLAMKLFGSKKALMKERIRQKAAGHWVIHPCSSFR